MPDSDFPKLVSPAQRALAGAGFQNLSDLSIITEEEFSKLHGIGPNALKTLKTAMAAKKLSFKK